MDAGIDYIIINDQPIDMRFKLAEACNKFTEPILRKLFLEAGMELKEGNSRIECSHEDLHSRYDLNEGIDMILRFIDDTKGTLQQKILYTDFSTATFEEFKNSGKPGSWYYCTAQYYFVIYTLEDSKLLTEQLRNDMLNATIKEAILLNLAEFHRLSLNDKIIWNSNVNKNDGRRNPFRYTFFNDIPDSCIIGRYNIFK